MILASGNFQGVGDTTLSGGFSIILDDNGMKLETGDDFYFSGARAPGWAFFRGKLEEEDSFIESAAMAYRIGPITRPQPEPFIELHRRQIFHIPDRFKLSQFDGLMAWCYGTPKLIGAGYFSRPAFAG